MSRWRSRCEAALLQRVVFHAEHVAGGKHPAGRLRHAADQYTVWFMKVMQPAQYGSQIESYSENAH